MDESVPAAYHSVDYSRSLGKSYIFWIFLSLSFVGWFTSLVSQAIVTSNIGNAFVGTLWFAIVLQLGVILGIIISWISDTLFQYGIALAIFAALATSYGAQGVSTNVFNGSPAQKALSAGWLITCILDVLWILILSSEPSSAVYRFVATNGRMTQDPGHMNGAIQNVSTNLDAFPKYEAEGIPLQPQPPMAAPGSAVGSNADIRESRLRSSVAGDGESRRRRSAGMWSTPPQTPVVGGGPGSTRGEVPPIPEAGPLPPPAPPSEGTRPTSTSNLGPNRPDSTARTTTDATPVPQNLPRALALFDYTASPSDSYELTFVKGEVLEVIDNSGKWWEAIKSDGTKGIAPSNYLKMM